MNRNTHHTIWTLLLLATAVLVILGLVTSRVDGSEPPTTGTITLPTSLPETTHLTVFESAGQIITFTGIPQVQVAVTSRMLSMPSYQRPEKPEQVTATLWTADGRRWIARWEEAKP